MDKGAEPKTRRGRWLAALRCVPFTAVILCFLLPFFSVSSCSDQSGVTNAQASATGFDVVLSRPIYAQPANSQYSASVQADAQSISHAARPWAILTLILCAAGIALSIRMRRYHRLVNAGLSAATFGAVIMIWRAVAPTGEGGNVDIGVLLASLVLALSLGLQACVWIWLGLGYAARRR